MAKEQEDFAQYLATVFRNGKCFNDVYGDRDKEIAQHAWSWSRQVGAEHVAELEKQLRAMTEERDCWIANAKNLQVGYNELDARLRKGV